MENVFKDTTYGREALARLADTRENFMLYCAEVIGEGQIKCTGGVFRAAKSGKRKGEICILVPDTSRSIVV